MANKFKKMGMGKGDHVAIVGLNHLNYLPAKLGVVAAGGVPVLFNPLHNSKFLFMCFSLNWDFQNAIRTVLICSFVGHCL